MKLNNKGFAITATLYTILILFLMILVSVLSGLVNKEKLLEKSTESISENYKIVSETDDDGENDDSEPDVEGDEGEPVEDGETDSEDEPGEGEEDEPAGEKCAFIASGTGKYIFTLDSGEKCTSYLKKDTCIHAASDLKFTTKYCNDNKGNITKEENGDITQPTIEGYFKN